MLASTLPTRTYSLASNADLFSVVFVDVDFNTQTDDGFSFSTAGNVVVNSFGGSAQDWNIDFDIQNAGYLEIDRTTGPTSSKHVLDDYFGSKRGNQSGAF